MIRSLKVWNIFAFVSLLLLIAPMSWGQTGTTSVRGVVSDTSGAPVSGARITSA
jgi:hypothetical protein